MARYSTISVWFFTVAVAAAAAGESFVASWRSINRIVGGENAKIESYPYQVSLQEGGRHFCGGSILSINYVLTAGHCIEPNRRSTSMLSVRVGTSFRARGGSVHVIEKVVRHENYSVGEFGIPMNDVAVIKVKTPFTFCNTVKAIGLFNSDEESLPAGEAAIATGWGRTKLSWIAPKQLQSVSIPIVEKRVCDKAYRKMGGLPRGQICAGFYGKGGKDACQGDSGGPLAIAGRLAGLVSWGNGCGESHFPGVFTEVAHYRQWIDKHMLNSIELSNKL